MSETVTFYCLRIYRSDHAQIKLFVQEEHNELFLSPHGSTAGLNKAHLDCKTLAEELKDKYIPRLKDRYGEDLRVEIEKHECSESDKITYDRIRTDSEMARKRLEKEDYYESEGVSFACLAPRIQFT